MSGRHQILLAADSSVEDISLTEEETALFIDLWEQHACLWNCRSRDYKSKLARQAALSTIAETFGRNWTAVAVNRKIESLKAYYRFAKKRATGVGTPTASKRAWPFLDRVQSLVGPSTKHPSTESTSQQDPPTVHDEDEEMEPQQDSMTTATLPAPGTSNTVMPSYPEMHYALTVADRLQAIKSNKRRLVLKHKIDCLIHEVQMEEVEDD